MICVGLPRAGTDWLYDQLAGHPDFWMPPIKELGALGGGFPPPPLKLGIERVKARKDDSGRGVPSNRKPLDARDFAFFERAGEMIGPERTLDDYAALFEQKGALLSGDVTPSYGRLPEAKVAAVANRFPGAKAVLMLRDPVERAWSHWRMRVALGRDEATDVQDADAFARFLDMPMTASVADAVAIADRWSAAFGPRFRYFFLDDVVARPAETRAEILRFIGGDPSKASRVQPDHNRKAAPTVERSDPVRSVARERLEKDRRRWADAFGGPAIGWAEAPF